MSAKDEKNLAQVLGKIEGMDEPRRSVMLRVHEVIMEAVPELKPRIWYGMPAYALSASSPALISLRNDERMNMSIREKVDFVPAGGVDGLLMPSAWYFEMLDEATEKRIASIAQSVVA